MRHCLQTGVPSQKWQGREVCGGGGGGGGGDDAALSSPCVMRLAVLSAPQCRSHVLSWHKDAIGCTFRTGGQCYANYGMTGVDPNSGAEDSRTCEFVPWSNVVGFLCAIPTGRTAAPSASTPTPPPSTGKIIDVDIIWTLFSLLTSIDAVSAVLHLVVVNIKLHFEFRDRL